MSKNLIFVDVEATGPCPGRGVMTEFGAVHYPSKQTYHGKLHGSRPHPDNPALSQLTGETFDAALVMADFEAWLELTAGKGRLIFVSDNPAFDFQWVNYYFWHYLERNPFGHSARRIGDFWAGIQHNFYTSQDWKSYRVTPHDHNPVNDAMGNVEAFERILTELKSQ